MFKLAGSTILESMMAVFVMSAGIGLFMLAISQAHLLITPANTVSLGNELFHNMYSVNGIELPSEIEKEGLRVVYQVEQTDHPDLYILHAKILNTDSETIQCFQKLVSK